MSDDISSIVGTLAWLPVPCTTTPCLPGMALAITGPEHQAYFLLHDGVLVIQGQTTFDFAAGDMVVVRDQPHRQLDIAGKSYQTIESTTLKLVTQ